MERLTVEDDIEFVRYARERLHFTEKRAEKEGLDRLFRVVDALVDAREGIRYGMSLSRELGERCDTQTRRIAELEGRLGQTKEALRAWIDHFDKLTMYMDASDPMLLIHHRVHGERMKQSRAALTILDADPEV